jgi:trehalose/maltose transport system substrate-binding protein
MWTVSTLSPSSSKSCNEWCHGQSKINHQSIDDLFITKDDRMKPSNLKMTAAAALVSLMSMSAHAGVSVTIACGTVGQDFEFCKKAADEWSTKTGNTVKHLTVPQNTSDILGLFRQMFAAKSTDLDVINVDVVWPGIIKDHLLDLTPYSNGAEKEHFPAIVANNTVGGKLVAMPWFTDAGVLYYRKDLLSKYNEKAPTTWAELTATAQKVMDGERKAGNADMQGFVFQAKATEGLTCDAVEWVSSYGGGNIVDGTGKITINNPNGAQQFLGAVVHRVVSFLFLFYFLPPRSTRETLR